MTLDDALFLVNRNDTTYRCKGADIGNRMVAGDSVLVQRGSTRYEATYDGTSWDKIDELDLLLAWDGTKNRRVTGENFKALFTPPPPPPAALEIPVIRYTGETNGLGQLKYELVSNTVWNRPHETRFGYWEYTRDGSYWYQKYDDYGGYWWYDDSVMKVRYQDRAKFDGSYYGAFSAEHPIGT